MARVADDSGAASVVALGLVGAIVALAALLAPVLGVFVATQRVANAADAAALAAADATSGVVPGVPCDLAADVAARNGATLTACEDRRTGGRRDGAVDAVRIRGLCSRPCRAARMGGLSARPAATDCRIAGS